MTRNKPGGPLGSRASFLQCPYYVHHSTEHVNCRSLVFTQLSRLKIHIKIHYRPVQCSKCGKRFATRYELKRHLRERKHPCAAKKFERIKNEEHKRNQRLEAATSYEEIESILFPRGSLDNTVNDAVAIGNAFANDALEPTLPEYQLPYPQNENIPFPENYEYQFQQFNFPLDYGAQINYFPQQITDFNLAWPRYPLESPAYLSNNRTQENSVMIGRSLPLQQYPNYSFSDCFGEQFGVSECSQKFPLGTQGQWLKNGYNNTGDWYSFSNHLKKNNGTTD